MKEVDKKQIRSLIIKEIRNFFHYNDFIETDTPAIVRSPGMEPHIRPIGIKDSESFLHTSPEFAMKKILADGYERIFQICKTYRKEPKSKTHHPEFTMLEWYRANASFLDIMDDTEALFEHISKALHGSTEFEVEKLGKQNVKRPWKKMTVEECFREYAKLELTELFDLERIAKVCIDKKIALPEALDEIKNVTDETKDGVWDDFFFRLFLNEIEPKLAILDHPVIVYNYPESQAALSNLFTDDRGFTWAKRFEVYAGGLELANAFDELTDPKEQRARFEKDMKLRESTYNDFPASPIDEELLSVLDGIPRSGGIALGVDRLVMYFTGAMHIEEVLWKPSHLGCVSS